MGERVTDIRLIPVVDAYKLKVWTLPDLVETRLSLSETKRRRGYGNEEKDVHRRIQT